jgi:single-strand DNA-binding protein
VIFCTVTGNVGKVESKTAGGQELLEFSVASSEKVKGEQVTTWVRCSLWGKRASALAPHIQKGSALTVVGSLRLREYEGKNGKGSSLELNVTDLAFGGKREAGGAQKIGGSSSGGGGFSDDEYMAPTGGDDIPFD